jgi:type IV secretory pathway VirB4 component
LAPPRPLSCLLTHLRSEAPEFLPAVELWTRPPRDRFFDSGQDTVATAKNIYFELTGLEDDPLVAVPFVMALMGTVWRRIQDPRCISERKTVTIDEGWDILGKPAFVRPVEEMFRTSRKFNAFVVLATQSPKDIKDGNARKLLQTMSEVFLYRGFSEPEFMENDLQLTRHQIELHRGLREDDSRREVLYVCGRGHNRVLSVEIPPALYWFATTDGEDKHWRGLYCGRFGLAEGIAHLVRACEGRTIAAGTLRIEKVAAYARQIGLAP